MKSFKKGNKIPLLSSMTLALLLSNHINAQWTPVNGSNNPSSITVDGTVYLGKGGGAQATNLAVGTNALPSNSTTAGGNTAIGTNALFSNTSGVGNTGVGNGTLNNNTTGSYNTALGYYSMYYNVGGINNTAIGYAALGQNVSNNGNTAMGHYSLNYLRKVIGATFNSSYGYQSLKVLDSGINNTVIGANSASALLTGDNNVGAGVGSLGALISGNSNIAIGYNSMNGVTTGSNNIVIGSNATLTSTSANYQLNIQNVIYGLSMTGGAAPSNNGNVGIGTVPGAYPGFTSTLAKLEVGGTLKVDVVNNVTNPTNKFLYWGSDGVIKESAIPSQGITSSCNQVNYLPRTNDVAGNVNCSQVYDDLTSVGIGSTGPFGYTFPGGLTGATPPPPSGTLKLKINGVTEALAYYATSDERYKTNIKNITGAMSIIQHLRGVKYSWKYQDDKRFNSIPQIGFIAQEVEKILPEAVLINTDGYYSMNYTTLIPVLTEGIKEQQSQLESQKMELENVKTELAALKAKINQLTSGEVKIKVNTLDVTPNPITGTSTVSYKLDNANAASVLVISDLQGKLIRQIALAKNQSSGQITVNKNELSAGMYIFTLVSGNAEVQSKKVLVAE